MKKTYEVVCWPEVQELFEWPGFRENSYLVNDEKGMEDFGSSSYFVDSEWLRSIEEELERENSVL